VGTGVLQDDRISALVHKGLVSLEESPLVLQLATSLDSQNHEAGFLAVRALKIQPIGGERCLSIVGSLKLHFESIQVGLEGWLPIAHPLQNVVDHVGNLNFIKAWLQECDEEHDECKLARQDEFWLSSLSGSRSGQHDGWQLNSS